MTEKVLSALEWFYTSSPLSSELKLKTIKRLIDVSDSIFTKLEVPVEFSEQIAARSLIALSTAIKLQNQDLNSFKDIFSAYNYTENMTKVIIEKLDLLLTTQLISTIQTSAASQDQKPKIQEKEEIIDNSSNLDDLF